MAVRIAGRRELRGSGYKGHLEGDTEDVVSWGFGSKGKEDVVVRVKACSMVAMDDVLSTGDGGDGE